MTAPRLALLLLLLAAARPSVAEGGVGLRFDPFRVPELSLPSPPPAAVTEATPAQAGVWNPELRAVMVAGGSSTVNVDGELVQLGEELNGYRLVEVRERRAVFERGGTRYELEMQ